MSSDFLSTLQALQVPVRRRIEAALPKGFPEGHCRAVGEYPRRSSKYFRPALVLLGVELFGGEKEKAIGVAAAVQLSEEWLLVHDDAEDHSPLRRGAPALQELWGDEIAINAGDALHILMWRMVGEAMRELPSEVGWRAFDRLNEILLATTEGQFLELDWRREGKIDITEDEYLAMAERKSARYSVCGPLELGAIVAGAGAEEVREIAAWGMPFGIAFQIWDDLLGLQSATGTSGKRRFEDIREGKRTLILIHCLAHAEPADRERLLQIYKRPMGERTEAHERYVVECMERTGSIAYAEAKAKAMILEAEAAFEVHTARMPETPAKLVLRDAMAFAVTRDH